MRPLIVIPAWNEQDVIAQILGEVHDTLPGWDVVVVSDGSTDRTARAVVLSWTSSLTT